LNHKKHKEETRQRFGEPIEYVLSCLREGKQFELFDVINAQDQLQTLRENSHAQQTALRKGKTLTKSEPPRSPPQFWGVPRPSA
jgi:hypothetical protein